MTGNTSILKQANLIAKTAFEQFGNTVLKTTVCPTCKRRSFLIDGVLQCCGLPIGDIPATSIKVTSVARRKRHKPTVTDQLRILEQQENHCLYCGSLFGSVAVYRSKMTPLTVCWDHYVPYSYSFDNRASNFVASCPICNNIKSNLMFDTLADAKAYINKRRAALCCAP